MTLKDNVDLLVWFLNENKGKFFTKRELERSIPMKFHTVVGVLRYIKRANFKDVARKEIGGFTYVGVISHGKGTADEVRKDPKGEGDQEKDSGVVEVPVTEGGIGIGVGDVIKATEQPPG